MTDNRFDASVQPIPAPLPPEARGGQNQVSYPLSRELIAQALDGLGLKYRRDSDGDIFTGFSADEFGGDLSVWLLVVGDAKDIFRIAVAVNRKIPRGRWQTALMTCNEYHQTSRYGRAYLRFEKPEGHSEPTLCFDAQIPLEDGVTEGFLKTFIVKTLEGAHKLFATAHTEKRLY
jgi:hypothetical protein